MTVCPYCHHPWRDHEKQIRWDENTVLHECGVNMGMGNWCGCKEERPEDWSDVEDVIQQVESGTRMTDAAGRITGYVVKLQDWRQYAAQLRRGA